MSSVSVMSVGAVLSSGGMLRGARNGVGIGGCARIMESVTMLTTGKFGEMDEWRRRQTNGCSTTSTTSVVEKRGGLGGGSGGGGGSAGSRSRGWRLGFAAPPSTYRTRARFVSSFQLSHGARGSAPPPPPPPPLADTEPLRSVVVPASLFASSSNSDGNSVVRVAALARLISCSQEELHEVLEALGEYEKERKGKKNAKQARTVNREAAEIAAAELGVALVFGDSKSRVKSRGGATADTTTSTGSTIDAPESECTKYADIARVRRPPVVVVMGHVDHGKTSLLDALRRTNVVDGEAGGITQHIGAFHVNLKDFMDTDGSISPESSRSASTAGLRDFDDGVVGNNASTAQSRRRAGKTNAKVKSAKGKASSNVNSTTSDSGGSRIDTNSSVTFLDTPGHAAFSAMRARGSVTGDIGVLCVALDDGVMPQTKEAYGHIKDAELPFVVAMTKADKFKDAGDGSLGVAKSRVLSQLHELGVFCDDIGGDVPSVTVGIPQKGGGAGASSSPASRIPSGAFGLYELVESITFLAELADIRTLCPASYAATATPGSSSRSKRSRRALPSAGVVIESRLDKGRGPLATLLVRQGILKTGASVLVGNDWGRIRSMRDWNGKLVQEASASIPVEVDGLRGVVASGSEWEEVDDERKARSAAKARVDAELRGRATGEGDGNAAAEKLDGTGARPDPVVVPIIIKADVLGTVEALRDALMGLCSDVVTLKVLHVGVGSITNNDVTLAASSSSAAGTSGVSEAVVVGFNVSPIASAQTMMERERVLMIHHPIIYDILEDVSEVLRAAAPMREEEAVVGTGVVMKTFEIKKKHGMESSITIAGSKVLDGRLLSRTGPIDDGARNAAAGSGGVYGRRKAKDYKEVVYRKFRVLRAATSAGAADRVVFEGLCSSIRHHQNVIDVAGKGSECGIIFNGFNDIVVNDRIECIEVYKLPAHVEDVEGGGFRVFVKDE